MFLLDTNVVSELRRPRPDRAVVAWLREVRDQDLHLAAVTVGELQAGVESLRARDPIRAGEIEAWIDIVAASYNILPADSVVFRAWARLTHGRTAAQLVDGLIAATAEVNGLIVVTRNVRDFARLGARVFDPFQDARAP